jgi:hypothetical protein
MLDVLVAGTTDPDMLADLARGKLRAKIPPCGTRSRDVSRPTTRW